MTSEPDNHREPEELAGPDGALLEIIEKAQDQYRAYVEIARIGMLTQLSAPSSTELPPRTDLPLTLTVA